MLLCCAAALQTVFKLIYFFGSERHIEVDQILSDDDLDDEVIGNKLSAEEEENLEALEE